MGATQQCCTTISEGNLQRIPLQKVGGKPKSAASLAHDEDVGPDREVSEEGSEESEYEEDEDDEEEEEETTVSIALRCARGLRFKGVGYVVEWGTGEQKHKAKAGNSNGFDPAWNLEVDMTARFNVDPLTFKVFGAVSDASSPLLLGEVTLHGRAFLPDGFNGDVLLQNRRSRKKAYLSLGIRPAGTGEFPDAGAQAHGYRCRMPTSTEPIGWPLDLDINPQDKEFARILSIPKGPFQTYNNDAEPDHVIAEDDFICAVNNCRTPPGFKEVLSSSCELTLEGRRSRRITASLSKKASSTLGLELYYDRGPCSTIIVLKVNDDGLIRSWNQQHPQKAIRALDRIVAVQGKPGKVDDLLKALGEETSFIEVTFARPVESGSRSSPVDLSALTEMSCNDLGLRKQPAISRAKMAIVQVYVRTEPFGGFDKSANGHCFDAVPLANGLIVQGISCQLLHYVHEEHDAFMKACQEFSGILLRCSPGQVQRDGGSIERFMGGLRLLRDQGLHVSPSPDVIDNMGSGDVLAKVASLKIGLADTKAYYNPQDLRDGLKRSVAFRPRLLSHGRNASASSDGRGTWLIKLPNGNYCGEYGMGSCSDTDLLSVTDMSTGVEETHSFTEVCEFFSNGRVLPAGKWTTRESGSYFTGSSPAGGFMMDERFHGKITDGEVCCTMFSDSCVHIAHVPPSVMKAEGGSGDPDMARRFAQSSDFLAKDLGRLGSALGLKESLPPWWSARFVPVTDGAANERWALRSLDCFGDVLPHCRAAACTVDDPTASYKDIPAECRAEAMRLTRSLTVELLKGAHQP
mmetsp:Transcript_91989/g.177248  ORF Transcript_91989/g.177248 Transcript_91989/m.177248 type:complete len:802 (-) Transcript_91989:118-2523(-)|eukprot:CAMPEP_0172740030 /NCGR_PEP_ID=MMETSP1074-20121228/123923_1 /TAXON_ID=2916 /ORGANISM="Ceratium fusus, Strain PA161109" /LENGTH=801 /DNA_ID=CAMNT_0013570043 /DNA_START=1 /DNA_END=2406 /DNA_ORIENTATION=-